MTAPAPTPQHTPIRLDLPATHSQLRTLHVGDTVALYGTIYTMRDAGHQRALDHLNSTGTLPFDLAGQALFYAGPTPAVAGQPLGAIGPTTAARMDFATPQLLAAGITLTLGKGRRSPQVAHACQQTGSVYLATTGGAAAYLAGFVTAAEPVAWPDLGTEALVRLTLNGLPALVAIDTQGNDLYAYNDDNGAHAKVTVTQVPGGVHDEGQPGVFITFEGGEGVGKSTQILLLAWRLEAAGIEVLRVREPGGTHIGEEIRSILLDPQNTDLDDISELLLYEAARSQIVSQVIKPALDRGATVLCDRFTDSTTAYQGVARGLDLALVEQANHLGSKGLVPQRTIVLMHDTQEALNRAVEEGADRLEAEGLDFHERVAQGFIKIARLYPQRVRLVPSQPEKGQTAELVFDELKDLFPQVAAGDFVIDEDLLARVREEHD